MAQTAGVTTVGEPLADCLRIDLGRLDGKQVANVIDGSGCPARPPGVLHERRGVDQRIVPSPQHEYGHPHGIERLVRRPLGDEHGVDDRRERRGRARQPFRVLAGRVEAIEPQVDLRVGDPARVSADEAGAATGDGARILIAVRLASRMRRPASRSTMRVAGGPAATARRPSVCHPSASAGDVRRHGSAGATKTTPRILSGIIPAASAATRPPVDQPCSTTWLSRRSCRTKADTKRASRSARGPCRYGAPVWPAIVPGRSTEITGPSCLR